MEASNFASQLAETALNTTALVKLGLTLEDAKNLIGCSIIATRITPLTIRFSTENTPDALLELISLYDVSRLEIGVIAFLEAPADYGDYLQIAKVELDPLVIYRNREIRVIDWQRLDHCMWKCARNSDLFLQALLMVNRFLTLTMLNADIYDDEVYALETASVVANVAGGSEYLSFYQMLFGV
ncbi:MAG: hypothetical protein EOO56_04300 [Hymenobacter sp.]|nr:MAG: hypothetical protein EOO56_04300 [Hymenobacter sp.]